MNEGVTEPLLYVTNLGDSQVMVIRPSTRSMVFKSTEQWHWFDCPRQLGTNSPDTPNTCAVVDEVAILEGDVVLAMSDGVIDNLWEHEIVEKVSESLERWNKGDVSRHKVLKGGKAVDEQTGVMEFVAEELMEAAKVIALDPYAESPFMEHAIEEGLASEGGELFPFVWLAGWDGLLTCGTQGNSTISVLLPACVLGTRIREKMMVMRRRTDGFKSSCGIWYEMR